MSLIQEMISHGEKDIEIAKLRAREIEMAQTLLLSAEKSVRLENENATLRARVKELEGEVAYAAEFINSVTNLCAAKADPVQIEHGCNAALLRLHKSIGIEEGGKR